MARGRLFVALLAFFGIPPVVNLYKEKRGKVQKWDDTRKEWLWLDGHTGHWMTREDYFRKFGISTRSMLNSSGANGKVIDTVATERTERIALAPKGEAISETKEETCVLTGNSWCSTHKKYSCAETMKCNFSTTDWCFTHSRWCKNIAQWKERQAKREEEEKYVWQYPQYKQKPGNYNWKPWDDIDKARWPSTWWTLMEFYYMGEWYRMTTNVYAGMGMTYKESMGYGHYD